MPRPRGARATRSSRLPETFEMQGHLIESYHHIDDLPRLSSEPKKRPRHVTRGAVAAERKAAAVAAATATVSAAPMAATSPRSTRRTRASLAAAAAAAAAAATANSSTPALTPAPTNPSPIPVDHIHPSFPSPASNPVPCRVCLKSNTALKIVRCSMCRKGIHTFCLNPPMMDLPNSASWKCFKCKRNAIALKKEKRMILRDALETYSALCTDDYVDKVIDAASVDAATITPGLIKPPSNTHQASPSRRLAKTPNNHNHTNLDINNTRAQASESIQSAQTLRAVIPIKYTSPSSAQPPPSNIPVNQNTLILRVPKDLMLDELDFDKPLPPLQGHAASQTPHPPPPKRRRISRSSKSNKHSISSVPFPIQQGVAVKPSTSRRLPHTAAPKKRKPLSTPSHASPPLPKPVEPSRVANGNKILSPTEPPLSHSQPAHAAQARSAPSPVNTVDPVTVPDSSSSSESTPQEQQPAARCKASDRDDNPHSRSTVLQQPGTEIAPTRNANTKKSRDDLRDMRHLPIVKRYTLDKSKAISPPRKLTHAGEQSQNDSPSYTFLSPKAAICDVPPRPAAAVGSTRNSSKRLPQIPCSLNLAPQQRPHRRSGARKSLSSCSSDQQILSHSKRIAEKPHSTVDRSSAKPSISATSSVLRRHDASIAPPITIRDVPNRTSATWDEHHRRSAHAKRGSQHSKENGNVGHVEVDDELPHVSYRIGEDKLVSISIAAREGVVSREDGRVSRSPKQNAPAISAMQNSTRAAASNRLHNSLPTASTMGSSAPASTSGASVRISDKHQLPTSVPMGADTMNVVTETPTPSRPWTGTRPFQSRTDSLAHPSTQTRVGCAPEVEPISKGCAPRSETIGANRSSVAVARDSSTLNHELSSPAKTRCSLPLSNVISHQFTSTPAQVNAVTRNQPSLVHPLSTQADASVFREVPRFVRDPPACDPSIPTSADVQNSPFVTLENVERIGTQSASSGPTDTRPAISTGGSSIQGLPVIANRNCGTEVPLCHPSGANPRPTLSQASGVRSSNPRVQPRYRDQTDNAAAPSKNHTSILKPSVDPTSKVPVTRSGDAKRNELPIDATRKLGVEDLQTQMGQSTPADRAVCNGIQSSSQVDVPLNESPAEATNAPVNVKELQWDAKREALLAFAQVQRTLAGNMQSRVKIGSNEGSQIARHMSRNRNVPETERIRMESTELAASSRLRQSSRLSSNFVSTRKGSISSLLHMNPEVPPQMSNLKRNSQAHCDEMPNTAGKQELNVVMNANYNGRSVGFRESSNLRPDPGPNRGQKRATRTRDSYDIGEDRLHYQTSTRYGRAAGSLSGFNKTSHSIHPLQERYSIRPSDDISFRHQPTRPKGGLSSFSRGHRKQPGPKGYGLTSSTPSSDPFRTEAYTANRNILQSRYHPQRKSTIQSLPSASNLRLPRPENSGQHKFRPYNNASDDVRRLAPVAFPPQGSGSAAHPCGSPPAIEPMEMPPFGRPGDPIRYNDQPANKYRMASPSASCPVNPADKSRVVQDSANGLFTARVDGQQETMALREVNYTHQRALANALSTTPPHHEPDLPFGLHGRSVIPNQATDTRVKEPSTEYPVFHPAVRRRTTPTASVARPRRFSVPYVQPETRRAQFEQGKALAFVGTSQGGHGLSSRRFNDIGLRTDSPMLHRSAPQRPSQRILSLASVPEPRLPLQIRRAKDLLPDLTTNSDQHPNHHPGLQASATLGRSEIPGTTLDQAPQLDSLPDSGLSLSKQIRALASQRPERGPMHTNVPSAPSLHYGGVTGEKPFEIPETSRPQGGVLQHSDGQSGSLVCDPLPKGTIQEAPKATTTVASSGRMRTTPRSGNEP